MAELTVDTISKMKVLELMEHIIDSSSLLSLCDFRELIDVNPSTSYFRIVKAILKNSLDQFERRVPLFKRSSVYFSEDEYIFVNNFDLFLEGTLTEDLMTLIPTSIVNFDCSRLNYSMRARYDRPILRDIGNWGLTTVGYMCKYPYVFKESDCKDFTEDSAIYYMSLDGNSSDTMFIKQVYLDILRYLARIKDNIQSPEIPIQLLGGLEQEIGIVDQDLQEFYRNYVNAKLFE